MESASSLSASSAKCFRGCWVLGTIRSISISRSPSDFANSGVGVPSRALNPRPSACLCAINDLLREPDIRLGSLRFNVVKQNGAAVARRLPETDVPRNDGCKHFLAEKRLQVGHHLIGKICSLIKHGQKNALELQPGIRGLSNLLNR